MNPKALHLSIKILVCIVKSDNDILLIEFKPSPYDLKRPQLFPVEIRGRHILYGEMDGIRFRSHGFEVGICHRRL